MDCTSGRVTRAQASRRERENGGVASRVPTVVLLRCCRTRRDPSSSGRNSCPVDVRPIAEPSEPFWLLVEDVCIAISMADIEQQVASLAAMSMNYQSKSGYVIKCSGRELAL